MLSIEFAARRNFLFDARCGAKDFFDKLKGPLGKRSFF